MPADDIDYEGELAVAIRAAKKAGDRMDAAADGDVAVEGHKRTVSDIVTDVDYAAQEAIVSTLRDAFPDDGLLAEEGVDESGRRRWVIDPLDGTLNFMRGLDYYSTSIALEKEGETVLGVVYSPRSALGKLWFAVRGFGAYVMDPGMDIDAADRLSVSAVDERERSAVFMRLSDLAGEYPRQLSVARDLVSEGITVRHLGSGAIELSKIASGSMEGLISDIESWWDVAAGLLIVEEAGGEVSIADSLLSDKYQVVASNNDLQPFLEEVADGFDDE